MNAYGLCLILVMLAIVLGLLAWDTEGKLPGIIVSWAMIFLVVILLMPYWIISSLIRLWAWLAVGRSSDHGH